MKKNLPLRFKLICTLLLLLLATPASAHHMMGGKTPDTFFAGFMSGLAHPIIGLDHFAFILGIGLLASFFTWTMALPLSFVLTSIFGTFIHLMAIDLPFPELIISLSVIITGFLLTREPLFHPIIILTLATIAGVFHGYAYGESIIGAENTPLIAYLTGFAVIQTLITFATYQLATHWRKNPLSALNLKFVGYLLCGIGITFTARFFGV